MTKDSAVAGPGARGARVPLLATREGLSPAQRAAWERIAESRGRVVGPFAVLLHSPEVARRVAELGHVLRFDGVLPAADRELAILAVARALDCQFEWAAHAPLARKAGVRDEAIAAIRDRRAPAGLTADEAAIVGHASALLVAHRVADDAFGVLRARLGDQGLVELTALVGYYGMIACTLNAFAVEPTSDERLPVAGEGGPP